MIAAVIMILMVAFHALVLAGVVPHDYVWGGNIQSESQMWVMESTSLLLNLIMAFVMIVRYRQITRNRKNAFVAVLIWLMVVLFGLNTVGNILAEEWLEKLIFTPITLVLVILCLRAALWKHHAEDKTKEPA